MCVVERVCVWERERERKRECVCVVCVCLICVFDLYLTCMFKFEYVCFLL